MEPRIYFGFSLAPALLWLPRMHKLLLISLLLAVPTLARADEPVESSYGVGIFATDVVLGAGTVALAYAPPSGVIGLVGVAIDGPIFHLIHHRPIRALASLGLRTGLTIGGALVGTAISSHNCQGDDFCGLDGFVIGGGVGLLTAMVVDWTILAAPSPRETVPRAVTAPMVSVHRGGATFGVAGTF